MTFNSSADLPKAMAALLEALSEADAQLAPAPSAARHEVSGAASDADHALEATLKTLMQALNQNGADEWDGKPVQEPLPFDFRQPKGVQHGEGVDEVEVVRVAGAASGSLDGLLGDYMRELKKLRKLEAGDEEAAVPEEVRRGAAPSSTDGGANPYGSLSLGELLDALDDFPMPPKGAAPSTPPPPPQQ